MWDSGLIEEKPGFELSRDDVKSDTPRKLQVNRA